MATWDNDVDGTEDMKAATKRKNSDSSLFEDKNFNDGYTSNRGGFGEVAHAKMLKMHAQQIYVQIAEKKNGRRSKRIHRN
jgi:hypothetical protein